MKVITLVIWEINRGEVDYIDQMVGRIAEGVREAARNLTMASFNSFFLKLAHINICSRRNKEMEISLFFKEHDIDMLILIETLLKSKFKLDIPNYIITCNYRARRPCGGVAILMRNNIKFHIADTCSPIETNNEGITILFKVHNFQQVSPLHRSLQHRLLILLCKTI